MTTTEQQQAREARADFEQRIYRRLTDTSSADPSLALPAPSRLRASSGTAHVRLDWAPVDGAAGYLIERSDVGDTAGEPRLLQHGGSDVPAVPHGPFADTGLAPGTEYRYRVAAVAGAEHPAWHWSEWASATPSAGPADPLEFRVDAATTTGTLQRVWQYGRLGAADPAALRRRRHWPRHRRPSSPAPCASAHSDLGVTHVRAHAILHDDNHVVVARERRHARVRLHRRRRALRPAARSRPAAGGRAVVHAGGASPAIRARPCSPTAASSRRRRTGRSGARWCRRWPRISCSATASTRCRRGRSRFGTSRTSRSSGRRPRQEYLRLYDESAAAVKTVDERLRVGGPSTAAGEWIEALAAHAERGGVALDFVHHATPTETCRWTRARSLRRHGFDTIPTWWTEWGVGSTHFGPIHDGVLGAPFVLSGYRDVQGRMQALAYWVISDHFEELGRPPALFHNGFGLLTVGNLRKPRYWAAHLAAHQGDAVLAAGSPATAPRCSSAAGPPGTTTARSTCCVWNGTVNAELMTGDAAPRPEVRCRLAAWPTPGTGRAGPHRRRPLKRGRSAAPPTPRGRTRTCGRALRARDRLDEQDLEPLSAGRSSARFEVRCPDARRGPDPAAPPYAGGTQRRRSKMTRSPFDRPPPPSLHSACAALAVSSCAGANNSGGGRLRHADHPGRRG